MGHTINLTCRNCRKPITKETKEYRRQIRRGKENFFCSGSCAASFGHKTGSYNYVTAYERLATYSGPRAKRKPDALSPYRWFARCIRRRGKGNSRKTTNLTPQDLKELFEAQEGICPLTGWRLNLPVSSNGWEENRHPRNASIDRINPEKGYIRGNVRFVSYIANIARNTYGDDTLYDFCKSVTNYHGTT
jgi:YHS domain-containing protein